MLNRKSLLKIVDLLSATLSKRIGELGISMELTDDAKVLLAQKGYDPQYGARPLRRTIQSLVEDKFSEALLDKIIDTGDTALVDVKDGEIFISRKNICAAPGLAPAPAPAAAPAPALAPADTAEVITEPKAIKAAKVPKELKTPKEPKAPKESKEPGDKEGN